MYNSLTLTPSPLEHNFVKNNEKCDTYDVQVRIKKDELLCTKTNEIVS